MFYFRDAIFPMNREVRFSFQILSGIGYWKSFFICSKIGLSFPFFIANLNDYLFLLTCFFFKNLSTLYSHIERDFFDNLELWYKAKCVRTRKWFDFLPVRGQRTRTNYGTRKREREQYIEKIIEIEEAKKKAEREAKAAEKKMKKEAKKAAKLAASASKVDDSSLVDVSSIDN